MPDSPIVSVIIPTYNRALLIGRAIQSVLDQSCADFELLVVDDASTDDTEQVVSGYEDSRIRYVRHEQNMGGGAARNSGIDLACGEYVAFLDSDDEWFPGKLERQLAQATASSPDHGIFYCDNLTVIGRALLADVGQFHEGSVKRHLLGGWCLSMTSSVLIRTELLRTAHFDASLPGFQDYDLWLRLSDMTSFKHLPETLVYLHQHTGERITSGSSKRAMALDSLEKKWARLLNNSDLALFENFLAKHRAALSVRVFEEALAGQNVASGLLLLLKNARGGISNWRLLKSYLRRYVPGIYGKMLFVYHHFTSRYMGCYHMN
jgi:glycosyltransferase involved in cell wall biosynthesis